MNARHKSELMPTSVKVVKPARRRKGDAFLGIESYEGDELTGCVWIWSEDDARALVEMLQDKIGD
jgi:hypothetical protein